MSTLPRVKHSRWFHRYSHAYNTAAVEPVADGHEMLDLNMLSPPVLDPDAESLQSCSTPLLRFSDPNAAAVNNGPLSRFREEEVQKPTYFQGWRMGVTLCAATTGTVLVINALLTVFASIRYGVHGGLGTIQEGSCRITKDLSLWLHLVINILSTLLLGASNYCMQCLASPTREEVDIAHGQQIWLDIGVPSVRNLRRIAPYRFVLWCLLAASTIPLHLLWNSAVFSTLASQEYIVFAASPALLDVAPGRLNWSAPVPATLYTEEIVDESNYTLQRFRNASSWDELSNDACIKAYGQEFVSARGDLVAITQDLNLNASVPIEAITSSIFGLQPYVWICRGLDPCNINSILAQSATWTISAYAGGGSAYLGYEYTVQYCLSKPVEERCRVQFSIPIMIIVIGCNFLKASCMFLTLWLQKSQPLVTLGDAIDSFLKRVDPSTESMCIATNGWFPRKVWGEGPIKWQGQRYRWFSSASNKRWLTCNFLCVCTLIAAINLLYLGLYMGKLTNQSFSHLWQMGYGAVTSESTINWPLTGSRGLLLAAIVANSPQVLLSFLFFAYNSLFTCMLLASEWNGYAHTRKPLRVTSPTGVQRSTYRLQLPYKYGVMLLVISGALHWLVSQSLFLAGAASFDSSEHEDKDSYLSFSTVGYSCIAIITVIVLGAIVVLLGILNGFRRYKPGIPLVGSCSAAISAACHRPKEDNDAAKKPLMWGVVSTKDGVGHCCFTSFEVTPPVVGERYGRLDGQK